MPPREDIKKIKARLEGAFRPLHSVAEVWDYEQKLRLKVFDQNDQGVVQISKSVPRHLSDQDIQDIIEQVRAQLQAKGFILIN